MSNFTIAEVTISVSIALTLASVYFNGLVDGRPILEPHKVDPIDEIAKCWRELEEISKELIDLCSRAAESMGSVDYDIQLKQEAQMTKENQCDDITFGHAFPRKPMHL